MKTSSIHLPSLLGTLLFVTGAVLILGVAVVLAIVVLANLLTGGQIRVRETILLAVLGFEGLMLLGAAYVSFQKVRQKSSADRETTFTISIWQIVACLFVAGVAILIGSQVVYMQQINWLLLPFLTLLAVLLPILVLFGLGVRGISLGPRWRAWNVLGISMTLVPLLTFVLEAIVIGLVFLLAIFYVASQPALTAQIERLAHQIYPGTAVEGHVRDFSPALSFDESGRAFTFAEQMVNPAIYVDFSDKRVQKYSGWLLKRFPKTWDLPDGTRVAFLDLWGVQYTGMQVRKDPGVGIVYLGCIIMSIGLYMTFFMSHRRIWVSLTEEKSGVKVIIGASANRNRTTLERKVEKLVNMLGTGQKGGK